MLATDGTLYVDLIPSLNICAFLHQLFGMQFLSAFIIRILLGVEQKFFESEMISRLN